MICAIPECEKDVFSLNYDICAECFQKLYLDLKVAGDDPGQTSLEDFE